MLWSSCEVMGGLSFTVTPKSLWSTVIYQLHSLISLNPRAFVSQRSQRSLKVQTKKKNSLYLWNLWTCRPGRRGNRRRLREQSGAGLQAGFSPNPVKRCVGTNRGPRSSARNSATNLDPQQLTSQRILPSFIFWPAKIPFQRHEGKCCVLPSIESAVAFDVLAASSPLQAFCTLSRTLSSRPADWTAGRGPCTTTVWSAAQSLKRTHNVIL